MNVPAAEALALAGIGVIALFGVWKTQLAPRLARRRGLAASTA